MNFNFTRKIKTETWIVQGFLAKAQKRPDIMALLQCVNDFRAITPRQLAEHLFFEENSREVVAERLLNIAASLSLVTKEGWQYQLTEKGSEALTQKEVFIPEDGMWKITFCHDPLLPHYVVDIQSYEEIGAYEELRGKHKEKMKVSKENTKLLPKRWQDCQGRTVQPFLGKDTFFIDEFENKAEPIEAKHQNLTLEWDIKKQSIRLMEGKTIRQQLKAPEDIDVNSVWQALLEQNELWENWDGSRLGVGFSDLDSRSKMSMKQNLKFEKPKLFDYGLFDDITVPNIALRALNDSDAETWAMWRLQEMIKGFATQENYQKWQQQAVQPFNEYGITMPTRDDFTRYIWQNALTQPELKETAWYLSTATDWNI